MPIAAPSLLPRSTQCSVPGQGRSLWNKETFAELAPGVLLAGSVTAAAFALRNAIGVVALSPLILAIAVGIAVRSAVTLPERTAPGIKFAMRPMLRAGIVLLGAQLTAGQVLSLGLGGIAVIVLTVPSSFLFTAMAGRWLGVERKLAQLIAAGTAICGASAVIAADTVTRADDEDVAYAIACVTIFGSAAMILYPLLLPLLHLDAHAYGLWTGSSIHEIAQVVAAAYQGGHDAGDAGLVSKLSRIILLAPVVTLLGVCSGRTADTGAAAPAVSKIPGFVIGFMGMIAANSLGLVPAVLKPLLSTGTTALLACGLAAMGLETHFAKLKAKGLRPFALGAIATVFISVFSLALIALTI